MKPNPLKGKLQYNHKRHYWYCKEGNIESAVEWLKSKIQKNYDDNLRTEYDVVEMKYKDLFKLINKAFDDVINLQTKSKGDK